MNSLTKLYLKLFLFTGILFGVLITLFEFLAGDGTSWWKIILESVLFGIAMSLFMVNLHKNRLKKLGVQEDSSSGFGVQQKKIIRSSLSKEEVVAKLKSHPVFGNMKMKEDNGTIRMRSPMSIKSWGENILITEQPGEGLAHEYLVQSSPKLITTLVDNGKNMENIHKIEKLLC